jgi:hypothetical protein
MYHKGSFRSLKCNGKFSTLPPHFTQACASCRMSKRDATDDAQEEDNVEGGESSSSHPSTGAPSVVGPPKPKKQKGMLLFSVLKDVLNLLLNSTEI